MCQLHQGDAYDACLLGQGIIITRSLQMRMTTGVPRSAMCEVLQCILQDFTLGSVHRHHISQRMPSLL